jgi:hypothetical protein
MSGWECGKNGHAMIEYCECKHSADMEKIRRLTDALRKLSKDEIHNNFPACGEIACDCVEKFAEEALRETGGK